MSKETLSIVCAGTAMVTLKPDGTLEYGEDYNPDETARIFWEGVAAANPMAAALSAAQEENSRLRTDNEKLRQMRRLIVGMTGDLLDMEAHTTPEGSFSMQRLRWRIEKLTGMNG